MTLYLIGIGLADEHDISMKGYDVIRTCDIVYYEQYTSRFHATKEYLEAFYDKPITVLTRKELEQDIPRIVNEANDANVAVLIIGSPLAATTHFEFILEATKTGVPCEVIDNASIFTAIGITGLSLYKFGRTTTLPFDNTNVTSPYDVYKENKQRGLHTLVLLDLSDDKMMTARDALDYFISKGLDKKTMCIGCGALGSPRPEIRVATADTLAITALPQTLIIPGDLNFKEQEALNLWKHAP